METQTKNFERQYDIDWIRIFLIFSVFLFHVGMVFNGWGWHIKNEPAQEWLHPIMSFLHKWRMPLLFLVSGVGTRYALGKRTIGEFIKERHLRLLVPFVLGVFILVPVQVYIEKIANYPSLGNFYLHMFEGTYPEGNFSWHHLWFILYLFVITLAFVPVIYFYRSKLYDRFEKTLIAFCRTPGSLLLFLLPIVLSQKWLLPIFPDETHALYNDWAYFSLNYLYFLYGFVLVGSTRLMELIVRDRYAYLGIAIISTYVMYHGHVFFPEVEGWLVFHYTSLVMSWTLGLAILGFSRKYFNKEHRWRKPLNLAIYPIYLLHQPIIIIVAYFVVNTALPVWQKAIFVLGASILSVWLIYKFLILPFNLMRFIFGMKPKRSSTKPEVKPAFSMVEKK